MRISVLIAGMMLCFAGVAQETPPAPENFVRFEIEGHDAAAKTLSDFTWYHFYNRGGNGLTLFNKEYLLLSDMWLGGAVPRGETRTIQEVHREALLSIELDDEGYVNTHQHFSHAHDLGWPFPIWTQSGKIPGNTAGWHFQTEEGLRGWTAGFLKSGGADFFGEKAVAAWQVNDLESQGIVENRWHLKRMGSNPALTSPEGTPIDAFQSPFFQIRWNAKPVPPKDAVGFVEWMGEGEDSFSKKKRVYFYPDITPLSKGDFHSILPMHEHPEWQGKITRLRITLPSADTVESYDIDSIFTVYDTRHTINNPIFIMASGWYFNWSGDFAFLRENIGRMRKALAYQQVKMGGIEHNHIRNTWPGHDGLPGFVINADGTKTHQPGHGIGNNYWDLMPFGWDDFYATYQYYEATNTLLLLEKEIVAHPEWDIPVGAGTLGVEFLENHLDKVKKEANKKFWNKGTERFNASIDVKGKAYDYGYTFLNLDAIWYGIASEDHAESIMSWLNGERVVEGDTSTGEDIYHWRFGPRATTRRNIEWYGHGWTNPESIPWGGQVQDGGAVLGFTFYDLWARLEVLGADNAWARLQEIIAWEQEVQAAGGYRAYYADGKQGTTLQGCNTAGGLGIDCEFYESSLVPCIVPYGFMRVHPSSEMLSIDPRLPSACSKMAVRNLWYQNARLDIEVNAGSVTVIIHEIHGEGITVKTPAEQKNIQSLGMYTLALK